MCVHVCGVCVLCVGVCVECSLELVARVPSVLLSTAIEKVRLKGLGGGRLPYCQTSTYPETSHGPECGK